MLSEINPGEMMKIGIIILIASFVGPHCIGVDDASKTAPRFKARIICFNGKLDSGTFCSGGNFQPDGTLHTKGKMTCGLPGQVSEIEWSFIERRGNADVYRFTRRFPANTPTAKPTNKQIEFSDRRVVIFEDKAQAIVIEPPKT